MPRSVPARAMFTPAELLELERVDVRMRDTFGGYDWGDPIVLWNAPVRRLSFSLDQWAIADRAVAS